ncbi:hypothetical protein [Geomonas subterranea]|uniref:hypothetical protein n=1 Tax=Geomonas subterranea TaxID=2847989 RepID=UPI001CD2070C|nr:hypothetical protein [Geomonas fuzhouensis]
MSDIIVLSNSANNLYGEAGLIRSQQRQVHFRTSNKESAAIQINGKSDAETALIAVDAAPDYGYAVPRRIENIAHDAPLSLPPPDPKSYHHLQARLAYESAGSLEGSPKKLLSISV